ncbi:hypothetical protein BV98_003874 [Sphingobium herbicidovorans NBRC 16415]|uniref:Uncharacterized protein n=1 Tax=Sphingobium herbicidovorans (strain ATCC 700291 / DSM 11019 / CCUG 56400 / KCTC 2939 / LMG 18315 / NBRC 16415 / MH) TaxID=1219045 RepID=A0A086P4H3_SPHHM|nr:hypothetical protein [Sphingobium herbicidovorans]KFG88291.1 hypothetical protein BV98_003874 [Sphingobium herbicidovorans NBRC 16415]
MATLAVEPQDCLRSMGHVALFYPNIEDGPAAAKLLKLLGFVETQMLPFPNGAFYRFVVHDSYQSRGDGIVYLSALPAAQAALNKAAREALGYGTDKEHEAVGALREAVLADPEYTFHIGTLVDSFDVIEKMTLDLIDANENDPDLKGRLKVTVNRPRLGNAEIDARLDASPAFGEVKRYAYGRNGLQLFVETDLLSSGQIGDTLILEFDYVWPGYDSHILSVVEL